MSLTSLLYPMNPHELAKRLIIQKLPCQDSLGRLISKPLFHHFQDQLSLARPQALPGAIQHGLERVLWGPRLIIPRAALLFRVMMRPLVTALPLPRQRSENSGHAAQGTRVGPYVAGAENSHQRGKDAYQGEGGCLQRSRNAIIF